MPFLADVFLGASLLIKHQMILLSPYQLAREGERGERRERYKPRLCPISNPPKSFMSSVQKKWVVIINTVTSNVLFLTLFLGNKQSNGWRKSLTKLTIVLLLEGQSIVRSVHFSLDTTKLATVKHKSKTRTILVRITTGNARQMS
ncbi:Bulb-type lectin domain-containing protein [Psidium guajava]|nr:Bulb-type lectin domain-containing protein [Psidium guajava]